MNGVDELVRELGQARRDVGRLKSQARVVSCPVPRELDDLSVSAVHAVDGYFDQIQDTARLLEAWTAIFRLKNTIASVRVELDRPQRLCLRATQLRARAHELVATSDALSQRVEPPLLRSRVSIEVVGEPPEDLPVWESVARVTCIAGHLDVVLRQDGTQWSVDRADEPASDGNGAPVADWRPHLEVAFQAAGLAVRRSS